MVTEGSGLQWVAEPFFPETAPVNYIVNTPAGTTCVDDSGQFTAVLTSVMQTAGLIGTFRSELKVAASETLNGTVVQCSDTVSIMMTKSLTTAGTGNLSVYAFLELFQRFFILSSPSFSSPAAKVYCFTLRPE